MKQRGAARSLIPIVQGRIYAVHQIHPASTLCSLYLQYKIHEAVPPESIGAVWSILVKKKIWKVTELFKERVCELWYKIINISKMFSWTELGQEVNAS